MKEKIKKWYAQGLWTANMVRKAAEKGVINNEDYRAITGNLNETEAQI